MTCVLTKVNMHARAISMQSILSTCPGAIASAQTVPQVLGSCAITLRALKSHTRMSGLPLQLVSSARSQMQQAESAPLSARVATAVPSRESQRRTVRSSAPVASRDPSAATHESDAVWPRKVREGVITDGWIVQSCGARVEGTMRLCAHTCSTGGLGREGQGIVSSERCRH